VKPKIGLALSKVHQYNHLTTGQQERFTDSLEREAMVRQSVDQKVSIYMIKCHLTPRLLRGFPTYVCKERDLQVEIDECDSLTCLGKTVKRIEWNRFIRILMVRNRF